MAIILNATPVNGFSVSSDNSGNIQFQSNATNTLSIASSGLMTAAYNGVNAGLVPGQQMFVLNTNLAGLNATGAQNTFGVGVTLASNTVYAFEADISLYKTSGTASHTVSTLFGGTASINYILYDVRVMFNTGGFNSYNNSSAQQQTTSNTTNAVVTTGLATNQATLLWTGLIKGVVSVNAGGTFTPQYSLSAAPGGAYSTIAGSYFLIYPIGSAGANVSIGTWA